MPRRGTWNESDGDCGRLVNRQLADPTSLLPQARQVEIRRRTTRLGALSYDAREEERERRRTDRPSPGYHPGRDQIW